MLRDLSEFHHPDVPTYDVLEWATPLDSSDFSPACWVTLAEQIEHHYYDYDGFVILHGTDTMAYTASALSFMLENLGKAVIITGAMIPMAFPVSDAKRNLIVSLMCAANLDIPEVCLGAHVRVATFGGGSIAAKEITVGTILVGADGEKAPVMKVKSGLSPSMIRITYPSGEHTVTPEHLVTLRWTANPSCYITQLNDEEAYRTATIQWYDRANPGAPMMMRWRFLEAKTEISQAEQPCYQDYDTAVAAALRFGDWSIQQGLCVCAQVETAPTRMNDLDYVRLNRNGMTAKYFKIRNAGMSHHLNFLPTAVAPHAREYALWWLARQQLDSTAQPLRVGDLFDVPAEALLKMPRQFSRLVSLALCNLDAADPVEEAHTGAVRGTRKRSVSPDASATGITCRHLSRLLDVEKNLILISLPFLHLQKRSQKYGGRSPTTTKRVPWSSRMI